MNEIDIVESTMSTDVGDTTANRFRYQWVCSAISCCALLDDKADIEEVFCEHHEDILLKRRDGKYIGVQVKTRDSTQPLWSASDEIVLKSFARFTVLNLQFPGQFCEFTFSTNHPMQSRRNGQDVCYLLDSIKSHVNYDEVERAGQTFIKRIAKIDLRSPAGKLHDVFQYMVEKTMHRPRDLIQFCKYVQKESEETGTLYFRTIKNAEKSYGYWLVNSELANEINPILKSTDTLYELLKLLGSRPFSLSDFYERYKSSKFNEMEKDELAYYLYDVGIFQNIDMTQHPARFRTSFRNRGKLDRNMKIVIHPGVWTGINA